MLLGPIRNTAIDRVLAQFQNGITDKVGPYNNGIHCLFHIDIFDIGKPISRNEHPLVRHIDSHKFSLIIIAKSSLFSLPAYKVTMDFRKAKVKHLDGAASLTGAILQTNYAATNSILTRIPVASAIFSKVLSATIPGQTGYHLSYFFELSISKVGVLSACCYQQTVFYCAARRNKNAAPKDKQQVSRQLERIVLSFSPFTDNINNFLC
jgi:hypothetical protein